MSKTLKEQVEAYLAKLPLKERLKILEASRARPDDTISFAEATKRYRKALDAHACEEREVVKLMNMELPVDEELLN